MTPAFPSASRGAPLGALVLFSAACGGGAVEPVPTAEEARGEARALDLQELRALGYTGWDEDADASRSGVTLHREGRVQPGLNLYTNDVDRVLLVDLEGQEVQSWHLPGKRNVQYAELLEDGSLLAVCVGESLTRMDPDGSVAWEVRLAVDHDFAFLPDGSILVAWLQAPRRFNGRRVVFDAIARVSPEGRVLERSWWSSFRAREELGQWHEPSVLDTQAQAKSDEVFDYHHLNTVEVLADTELGRRDERFRAGNVLLCLRNVDLVCILDGETKEVVWHWGPGELDWPHMPTLLAEGTLLVYDNGTHRGWTRVLELDPTTGEEVWSYRGDPPSSFFSELRGSNQRLANGNTLICESERGHAFEVTRDGEMVWEFWNPDLSEGRRRRIYRLLRVDVP